MKKTIFISLLFLSIGAFANTLKTFSLNHRYAGGAIDDEYIYLYTNQTSKDMINIANNPIQSKRSMINTVCKNKDIAKAINSGISIVYLYQSKNKKQLAILKINHCPAK